MSLWLLLVLIGIAIAFLVSYQLGILLIVVGLGVLLIDAVAN